MLVDVHAISCARARSRRTSSCALLGKLMWMCVREQRERDSERASEREREREREGGRESESESERARERESERELPAFEAGARRNERPAASQDRPNIFTLPT
eukprot:6213396-Pleurochrysis_carterae.AAC.1